MKNKLITTIGMMFICIFAFAQPQAPSGKKWQKVENMSDEFNGGLDGNKWYKELWDYAGTPTKMIAANSGVSDGNLWIKATLNDNSAQWFQSSRIYSKAQIKFPMYTESSIKTAHLSAYNTFWMNNGDANNRDEIDIIENNSRPSCGCRPNYPWQMNSQYFQVQNGDVKRNAGNFDNRNLSNNNPKKGVKWNEQYHTVGVWWKDARNIQFYLDGEPAGSVTAARDLTRNLNLIWDLWTDDKDYVGGLPVRAHLNNDNINTMRVDWVHTYNLVNDGGGTPPPPGNDDGSFYIFNRETGKKLRPANANNGAKLTLANANNTTDWVKWFAVEASSGYYFLENKQTGKYFRPGSAADFALVQQQPSTFTGGFTQWKRVNTNNDYFYLENRTSGKYFRPVANAVNTDVQLVPTSYRGGFTQWRFINAATGAVSKQFGDTGSKTITVSGDVQVYPNPVSAGAKVAVTGLIESVVNVYDVRGVKVAKVPVQDGTSLIDTSNLSSGLYFIRTTEGTHKLMVQ